ncbi:MAG TPA: ABC transporter permease [Rhizomicrobium sp.]|jgi:putative ABC transport system permease protein|nr:ABC transporter permease [Rhizomicrobium sp.]
MKYLFLVWSGLWRRRTRTILTLLSAVVAFFLFGMLEGVDSSIKQLVGIAHLDRLYTANTALLPLPMAYLPEIEKMPGVTSVTYVNAGLGSYQRPANQVAIFAVDPARYFAMIPEVVTTGDAKAAMLQDRLNVVVARPLAKKFGWTPGSRIVLHVPAMPRKDGTADWPVVIAGFCDYTTAPDTPVVLLNFDYFDAARLKDRGTVQRFAVKIRDPAQAGTVSAAIDALFVNSPAATQTETEKAFAQASISQIGDIDFLVDAIVGAVFFTLLLLVGNSLMQSFRERIREFAILKTIGFRDGTVAGLVIGEALLLCGLAGVIGLGLARLALPGLGRASGGLFPAYLSASVVAAGVGCVLVVSFVSALAPAWKAHRLAIVDALVAH